MTQVKAVSSDAPLSHIHGDKIKPINVYTIVMQGHTEITIQGYVTIDVSSGSMLESTVVRNTLGEIILPISACLNAL